MQREPHFVIMKRILSFLFHLDFVVFVLKTYYRKETSPKMFLRYGTIKIYFVL